MEPDPFFKFEKGSNRERARAAGLENPAARPQSPEIEKEIIMHKQLLKAATMLVGIITLAFASALAASAQSSNTLYVNVPFGFSVRDKAMPAGEYIVTRSNDSISLMLRRTDGSSNAIVLTRPVESRERQEDSKLVFNRYGDHYFLSQVWTNGDTTGREINRSRQEKALDKELARNQSGPAIVTLVARAR